MGTRRGNREGSFAWDKPRGRRQYGRWTGALLITPIGRLTVTGRKGESKASVRARLHAKRDAYADVRRPTKGTLAEWCDVWLRLYASKKAPRTQDYYRAMLGHLLPFLGREPVSALTPEALLDALERIKSPSNRRKAYEVLRIALNRAVRTGRIRSNVCAMVDPPEVTPKEVEPPSAEDAARILAAVRGQRDEALIVVALATGLRQGEIVGLRWCDVYDGREAAEAGRLAHLPHLRRASEVADVVGELGALRDLRGAARTPTLHVRGQLNRQRQYVGAKRGSERVVSLPPLAAAALQAHRERVTLAQGRRPEPTDYVFLDAHGRAMTGFEAGRRWKRALEAAGVNYRSMHSARHFANTALMEAGMPPELVRAVIGHRDAKMTQRYLHATDEARRMMADVMERKLGNG